MKRLKFILFLILFVFVMPLSAQTLSQSDIQAVQQRAKAKVEEFQGYLSSIANTALSQKQRRTAKEQALLLFMGEGDPYYVTNDQGEREYHREVRMQTSSVNRASKSMKAMKKYLDDTYNNILKYSKVVIKSADVVRVDNVYKVGEGKYECMAYFCQEYISYGPDGSVKYGDVSRKKVKVYITATPIPSVGMVYEVKLGDIYVTSTERLKK
ncbi:MAG: hypothetical protein HDS03_06475 [Bacteroides sp.]|nr:hypothetical protein [Bacteroides sp.]